jgi:hypothetical protein
VFLIWSDTLPQLSIRQPSDRCQKGKHCQTHTACIDQRIILAYVQILLDLWAIRFKFHDRIKQRSISFQSAIPRTAQDNKCLCASRWSVKLCPTSNKCPRSMQGAYFRSHTRSVNQRVQISRGLLIDVPNHHTFYTCSTVYKKQGCSRSTLHTSSITFSMCFVAYKKKGSP